MKRIILLILVALIASTTAILAQDEGEDITINGQDITVKPLSVVTESEPLVFDITDTTAKVNFVSTEPLACYLIYGTDLSFGGVTNDPDMAQAAIINHNPIMFDLEPDTEYVFRMQGTGENGTLYVSDLYSFRTLPAEESANNNLLSPENGATVIEVSSNFGEQANDGRWGVLNAFDGNNATEWSSNDDGDDAYFIVELNDTYNITEIVYQTRAMSDGTAITNSFTITTDNGDTYGPFEVDDTEQQSTFEVDFEASSIRYDVVDSTGGNTGIVDIAVYGEPVSEE